MNLTKWYTIRAIIILAAVTGIVVVGQMMLVPNLSLLGAAIVAMIGVTVSYRQHNRLNGTTPPAMQPKQETKCADNTNCGTTEMEILEEIRSQLNRREPEIIAPQALALPTQTYDFNGMGKQVIARKIIEALEKSQIHLKVQGNLDKNGEVNISLIKFAFKTAGPAAPTQTTLTAPPRKPDQLTAQGRRN